MTPITVIRIRDWAKHFETSESRKLKTLTWVPFPTKHDGKGYGRVTRLPNATQVLCAWFLLCEVAAKLPVRGVLMDHDGPLSPDDLSAKTRMPEAIFAEAVTALGTEGGVHWLETVDGEWEPGDATSFREKSGKRPDVPGDSGGRREIPADVGPTLQGSAEQDRGQRTRGRASRAEVLPGKGTGPGQDKATGDQQQASPEKAPPSPLSRAAVSDGPFRPVPGHDPLFAEGGYPSSYAKRIASAKAVMARIRADAGNYEVTLLPAALEVIASNEQRRPPGWEQRNEEIRKRPDYQLRRLLPEAAAVLELWKQRIAELELAASGAVVTA